MPATPAVGPQARPRSIAAMSREISPLGLVLASGHWYLLAHRDQQQRTYRVSRIRSVELLDEPATRPAAFDLAQTWAEARSQLEHENTAIEVIVRVEPSALPRLRQLVPVHGQERIPLICTEQIDLTIPFESENWACAALLSLGKDVEVLQPAAMRERVAAQARAAVDTVIAARTEQIRNSGTSTAQRRRSRRG
jgi:predicted DNA-binding transcriptional regulator YafY